MNIPTEEQAALVELAAIFENPHHRSELLKSPEMVALAQRLQENLGRALEQVPAAILALAEALVAARPNLHQRRELVEESGCHRGSAT